MGPLGGARLPGTAVCPVHLRRERERAVTGGPGLGALAGEGRGPGRICDGERRLEALVRRPEGADGGRRPTPGQGWWEGSGAGVSSGGSQARRQPRTGAGAGVAALSPRGDAVPAASAQAAAWTLPPSSGSGRPPARTRTPRLGLQLPGCDAEARAEEARRCKARPLSPREPMGARGRHARALPGARASTAACGPAHARAWHAWVTQLMRGSHPWVPAPRTPVTKGGWPPTDGL